MVVVVYGGCGVGWLWCRVVVVYSGCGVGWLWCRVVVCRMYSPVLVVR